MGNPPASEYTAIRPTRLGLIETSVARSVGSGFKSLRFSASVFERDRDPLLLFDHFVMTGDTFAPHLHEHIATLTVLLDDSQGSLLNRDTVGGSVDLQAGDLYRLAAGSAAVHEQCPQPGARIHGLQIFVKLPCELHRTAPYVSHVRGADVPVAVGTGYRVRTLLGTQGDAGSGSAANEMTLLDGVVERGAEFLHRLARDRKAWLYVISGQLDMRIADGTRMLEAGQMTSVGAGQPIDVTIHATMTTHFILIAVEPVEVPHASSDAACGPTGCDYRVNRSRSKLALYRRNHMNHPPARARLLFNPLFRALWIGMIASSLGSALIVDGGGIVLHAATPAALVIAAVRIITGPSMCLLLLLSVVVSLYKQQHGPQQFAFRKMGSGTFAVSIFTFLGLAGPWFLLCAACILGLCAAMAMLSLQPVLLELLAKAELNRGQASDLLGTALGRTVCNLACGVLATVIGPAAIFILSAIPLGVAVIATRKANPHGLGTAVVSTR